MAYIGQAQDEWEAKRARAKREAARPKGPYCFYCEKRMRDAGGLKQHLHHSHNFTDDMWKEYVLTHQKPKTYL
jgi:hypothetical protein